MYNQRLNYLHWNPVTAGFVEEPWHWLYSSAADYLIEKKGLLEILILDGFWRGRLVTEQTQDGVLRLYGSLSIDIGNIEDLQAWRHVELEKGDVTGLIKSLNELACNLFYYTNYKGELRELIQCLFLNSCVEFVLLYWAILHLT